MLANEFGECLGQLGSYLKTQKLSRLSTPNLPRPSLWEELASLSSIDCVHKLEVIKNENK
jgi:hypothetical protein